MMATFRQFCNASSERSHHHLRLAPTGPQNSKIANSVAVNIDRASAHNGLGFVYSSEFHLRCHAATLASRNRPSSQLCAAGRCPCCADSARGPLGSHLRAAEHRGQVPMQGVDVKAHLLAVSPTQAIAQSWPTTHHTSLEAEGNFLLELLAGCALVMQKRVHAAASYVQSWISHAFR